MNLRFGAWPSHQEIKLPCGTPVHYIDRCSKIKHRRNLLGVDVHIEDEDSHVPVADPQVSQSDPVPAPVRAICDEFPGIETQYPLPLQIEDGIPAQEVDAEDAVDPGGDR